MRALGWMRARRAVAIAAVAAVALFIPASGLAVHDLAFQLDGDVTAVPPPTPIGGHDQTVDWDSLFDSTGATKTLPPDFTGASFVRDFKTNPNGSFNTSDDTTFATGSKDTLPIATGWQCTVSNNVNNKDDLMNVYGALYKDPSTSDEIAYFALERNTNTGSGDVAFWFLQDNADCVSNGTTADWTGDHKDGDILVVSAFTNGGVVSTIDAYRWNGGAGGSLGTTPIAHGVGCRNPATPLGDLTCAVVNAPTNGINGTITTPWLTANADDGVGHSLRTSEFFEGGLNLSDLGLADKCFNTFVSNTRTSPSLEATLFDYARGQLGNCESTTETTPVQSDGTTPIPPRPPASTFRRPGRSR